MIYEYVKRMDIRVCVCVYIYIQCTLCMHICILYIYIQLCDLSLDIILHSECILELSEPGNLKLILAVQGWLGDVSQVDFFSLDKKRVYYIDPNAPIKQPPKTDGFLSKHLTFPFKIWRENFHRLFGDNICITPLI